MSKKLSIIIALLLFLNISNYVYAGVNYIDCYGEVKPEIKNDTLQFRYDFGFNIYKYERNKSLRVDTLVFRFNSDTTLYPAHFYIVHTEQEDSVQYGEMKWRGTIICPNYSDKLPAKGYLTAYYSFMKDHTRIIDSSNIPISFFNNGDLGRRANVGIGFYNRSGFDTPVKNNSVGATFKVEDLMGGYSKNFNIMVGYSINHSGKFTLYDYSRIQGELLPWGGKSFAPILISAVTYSRIRGSYDSYNYIKKGFGVEAGIRLEGDFESIQYKYTTAVDGYHRADLVFAFESESNSSKVGTIYSFYHGKHVRMISVSFYMSGNDNYSLSLKNNRPFLHKCLSFVGLIPFTPIILLMSLDRS